MVDRARPARRRVRPAPPARAARGILDARRGRQARAGRVRPHPPRLPGCGVATRRVVERRAVGPALRGPVRRRVREPRTAPSTGTPATGSTATTTRAVGAAEPAHRPRPRRGHPRGPPRACGATCARSTSSGTIIDPGAPVDLALPHLLTSNRAMRVRGTPRRGLDPAPRRPRRPRRPQLPGGGAAHHRGHATPFRPGGAADGTFTLDGGPDGAAVTTGGDPDLVGDVSALSAAWLGGRPLLHARRRRRSSRSASRARRPSPTPCSPASRCPSPTPGSERSGPAAAPRPGPCRTARRPRGSSPSSAGRPPRRSPRPRGRRVAPRRSIAP